MELFKFAVDQKILVNREEKEQGIYIKNQIEVKSNVRTIGVWSIVDPGVSEPEREVV